MPVAVTEMSLPKACSCATRVGVTPLADRPLSLFIHSVCAAAPLAHPLPLQSYSTLSHTDPSQSLVSANPSIR